MSLSAIHILDSRGRVLVFRHFKDDFSSDSIRQFYTLLIRSQDEGQVSPIIEAKDEHFAYIKAGSVYIVASCRSNTNVAMAFSFLYKLKDILNSYFNTIEVDSVKNNFVIIYELLDEIIDYGFPQVTEPKILKEYITGESLRMDVTPPAAVTNAVSWRKTGIFYKTNTCYLDVNEKINAIVAKDGTILNYDVHGVISMNSKLSGMPECNMGFNDKILWEIKSESTPTKAATIELEDIRFHQCVKLSSFANERRISFVPPDGTFELMSYRVPNVKNSLFDINYVVKHASHSRVDFVINFTSRYSSDISASELLVNIPIPEDGYVKNKKCSFGYANYKSEINCLEWDLSGLTGGKTNILEATYTLPSITAINESKLPISLKFKYRAMAASGMIVRYLRVFEKSGYRAAILIRYITSNGDFNVRIN